MLNQSYKHITEIDHYIDNEDSKKDTILIEIEHVDNKWLLFMHGEKIFARKTLKEISKILFYMRSHLYDNGTYINVYDRNKRSLIKVGYMHMNRVLSSLEQWEEKERMYKHNLKIRRNQTQPIRSTTKRIDPKLLRPILREEKTW